MLFIYSEVITSRLSYVINWIAQQWKMKYRMTSNLDDFLQTNLPRIYYGAGKIMDKPVYNIPASGLLKEKSIVRKTPEILIIGGIPELYFSPVEEGFDVFSAVFFMLSRYEEYSSFQKDKHGRFPGRESIAFKNNFIQKPVVDIWVGRLKTELKNQFPQLIFTNEKFETRLTFDLDVAFKYNGRSLKRQCLSLARDILTINLKAVRERLLVLTEIKKDPWDIYTELRTMATEQAGEFVFFIPTGERTIYDRNLSLNNPVTQKLVRLLGEFGRVGLHTSYFSTDRPEMIVEEKKLLEKTLKQKVICNRFHFLRFALPDAYHFLIEQGIKEEYSMIYPDIPGFRAGTCKPFQFYDLKRESCLSLKVYAPCWMDSTFLHYPREERESPTTTAIRLMREIKSVNGIFIPIFHNSDAGEYGRMKDLVKIREEAMKLMSDE